MKATIARSGAASFNLDLNKSKTLKMMPGANTSDWDDLDNEVNDIVEWKSSNSKIATVDYNGKVTAKGAGTATITASAESSNSVKWTITVGKVKASKVKIAAIDNKTYTSKSIKPDIKATYNGTTLKEGTDYTLSYKNNTNMGTAKVTAKFKGSYTGSVNKTFKIVAPSVGKPKLSVNTSSSNYARVDWSRGSNATGVEMQITGAGNKAYNAKYASSSGYSYTYKGTYNSKATFKARSYKTVGKKTFYSGWVTTKA